MNIEERVLALNDTRRALLDEMEALDPAVLVARPFAGKWSILEIVEHLVVAERAVLNGLPDPSRLVEKERVLEHRVRYRMVMFVLASRIRVGVPSREMNPQGDRSVSELRRMWDENQAWLQACIAHLGPDGTRRPVFDHPIAGPLSVEQAIKMGTVHIDRHTRQIRRLQRALS